ncbi:hypothetical protein NKI50_27285 [Mesorhizobium sp. M0563]|uniref:hypothetical protein n=2 Tax=Mesorhizobium TaxID=68287 RepID=UPI003336BA1F
MAKTAGTWRAGEETDPWAEPHFVQSQLDWENAMQLALLIRPVWRQIFVRDEFPRAMHNRQGKLLHIHIAPAAFYEMEDLAEA